MVLCYGQDRFRCVRCCNLLQELASYLEVLEDRRTGIEQVSGEARKKDNRYLLSAFGSVYIMRS